MFQLTKEQGLIKLSCFKVARKGRSCVDQLFTVRQLGEIIEKNKRMLMVCVDLEKAYDRVDRELLWRVLRTYGVNGELMRAVRSLYDNGKACVSV